MHNFEDRMYWTRRWLETYPGSTPPELITTVTETKKRGWWIFARYDTTVKQVCKRCGSIIETGHICRDLLNYIWSL